MPGHALRRESTNHPFIVKNHGLCDGSPIIEGARTRVIDIVIEYEMLGCSLDEIISSHPHLNLPQVHDPLSFIKRTGTSLIRIARLKKKILSNFFRAMGKIKIYSLILRSRTWHIAK